MLNLYLDEEIDEFVLSAENKYNNYFTHWHPQNCKEAIDEMKNIFEEGISIVYESIDNDKKNFVGILFPIFLKDINNLVQYQKDSKYEILNIKNEIAR